MELKELLGEFHGVPARMSIDEFHRQLQELINKGVDVLEYSEDEPIWVYNPISLILDGTKHGSCEDIIEILAILDLLYDNGLDVRKEYSDIYGKYSLVSSCIDEDNVSIALFDWVLSKGVKFDLTDIYWSSLEKEDLLHVLNQLHKHGCDMNQHIDEGENLIYTLIMGAKFDLDDEVLSKLLEYGIDFNIPCGMLEILLEQRPQEALSPVTKSILDELDEGTVEGLHNLSTLNPKLDNVLNMYKTHLKRQKKSAVLST